MIVYGPHPPLGFGPCAPRFCRVAGGAQVESGSAQVESGSAQVESGGAHNRVLAVRARTECIRIRVVVCGMPPRDVFRQRFNDKGQSVSTTQTRERGCRMLQQFLDDMWPDGCSDVQFDEWISQLAHSTSIGGTVDYGILTTRLNPLLTHLLQKIKAGEPIHVQSGVSQPMATETPKIMFSMGLASLLNAAWQEGTGNILARGFFDGISAYKQSKKLLELRGAEKAINECTEADKRRDVTLYDKEQLKLFKSFAAHSYATKQLERGLPSRSIRHLSDTLTLAVITSVSFALGARNVNVTYPRPAPTLTPPK